jgi:rfaE bifunctional protein nucleotidyltransferase chain/domain
MLARTVSEGGESFYIQGRHADTVPALWTELAAPETPAEAIRPEAIQPEAIQPEAIQPEAAKVVDVQELARRVAAHKAAGRRVVHCHGCFDLMHPGHIKYFQAARRMGDVLVVTLSADRFVDKGAGRPVFSEDLRAQSIAALACVDSVAVNPWPTAVETLRLVRPDVYVKGQEFEQLVDKTGKLQQEHAVATELGIEFAFTHEIVFSSTKLLNAYFRQTPNGE